MTMREIQQSDKHYILAEDIADILEVAPNTLRAQAQSDPAKLGFPVVVCGSRVKVAREGFLFFMKYGRPVV